jgi:hypothetical protein
MASVRPHKVDALMRSGSRHRHDRVSSPKTVETHVRSIFAKLGLPEDSQGNRRVQAVIQWLNSDGR